MIDCAFCRIVAGALEASRVVEDERVLAFMDVAPMTEGHAVVVPREHRASLLELSEADAAAVWETAHRVARAALRALDGCERVNLFAAVGEVAGQEVPHAHLHVLPRGSLARSSQPALAGASLLASSAAARTSTRARSAMPAMKKTTSDTIATR